MNTRSIFVVGGVMAAIIVGAVSTALLSGSSRTDSSGQESSSAVSQTCEYPTWAQAQPLLKTMVGPCALQTYAYITPPTPRPRRTPVPVNTLDEAIRKASIILLGGYGQVRSELQSVVYVETTVGAARNVFTPDRRLQPDVPDDIPAWAFVAYGQFQHFCMACGHQQPLPRTALVVVIPKDGEVPIIVASDEHYDLAQLGKPLNMPSSVLRQICVDRVQPPSQTRVCGVYAARTAP